MPLKLEDVRQDSKYLVLTQHTNYIRPRALSDALTAEHGERNFKISVWGNIYVIYINIEVLDKEFVSGLTYCLDSFS